MVYSKDMGPMTQSFGSAFFKNQFRTKIPPPPKGTDLSGKVAIITGANSGLGFESARQLLSLGLSRLIMGVRSPQRGKEAATQLQKANPKAIIVVWPLEMESYTSIQDFARRCEAELNRIDIVILNAGLGGLKFAVVPATGHEKMIQINYLSTMLLAVLLLPILKSKSQSLPTPHLTVVSSFTSMAVKFPNQTRRPLLPSFDDVKITPWDPSDRYAVSKLLGQLFLVRLADCVDPDDVIINMVEPGWIKGTGLTRDVSGVLAVVLKLVLAIAGRPVQQGGATFVDAVAVQGKGSHGSYIMNCENASLAHFYYKPEGKVVSDQLWKETLDELDFAGVKNIIESLRST